MRNQGGTGSDDGGGNSGELKKWKKSWKNNLGEWKTKSMKKNIVMLALIHLKLLTMNLK